MEKNKKIFIITSIIIVIIICIAFTTRELQNDTFYTIKVGEIIAKKGIDMKDHFSIHNLPYTYPHWLYDLLVYKIFDKFNFKGLYIFSILTFMVIGISFYLINIKINKSYFISLLLSVFSTIMLARNVTARAQLLTYLFFILEIYFIERLLNTGKKRYGIYLLIDCLLIANIHSAVWPFYFVLMLPYLFEELIALINKKIKSKPNKEIFPNRLIIEHNKNIKYLLIVFGISLFVGLLTPIFPQPYTYFINIMRGDSMEYIQEHQPLILKTNVFTAMYLIIFLTPIFLTKVKIKLSDLAMILGLLLMSFLSVRHTTFLAIIGGFYLCRLICNIGFLYGKKQMDFDMPLYGSVVVLITTIITASIVYNINFQEDFINKDNYPVTMVDYIYDNLDVDNMVLFNQYDFGSYLLYRDLKVFIDSRCDLYTKPFNKKEDIFDEVMNISQNYGRVFNKYDVTHILIYNDTKDYLFQILNASSNYRLIKKEGRFSLYEYIRNKEE